MNDIATMDELKEAIRELEHQDYVNQQFMKKRVEKIVDDLKPVNLVKNMFKSVVKAPETKTTIFGMFTGTSVFRIVAGVAASFVARKFFKKSI
jgi:hypothetical protein